MFELLVYLDDLNRIDNSTKSDRRTIDFHLISYKLNNLLYSITRVDTAIILENCSKIISLHVSRQYIKAVQDLLILQGVPKVTDTFNKIKKSSILQILTNSFL